MMKQRNIPVTQKSSFQVQTQIHFSNELNYNDNASLPLLTEQRLRNSSGLYNSMSTSALFKILYEELEGLRKSGVEGLSHDDQKRRLQWLEKTLEGLSKRGLNYRVQNGSSDYYSIINDLQAKLEKQIIINNNYETKLKKCTQRIAQLQNQIQQLNLVVIEPTSLKTQNQKFKQSFLSIHELVKDPRKIRDVESLISKQILPIINEFDVKYDDLLRRTTVTGRAVLDPKNKIKSQLNNFVRNLDKLVRGTEELTLKNIQKYTIGFLKQLDVSVNQENIFRTDGKPYRHLYEDLRQRYAAAASIYKTRLESLVTAYPQLNIKHLLQGEQFRRLSQEGVIISSDAKFITIPTRIESSSLQQDSKMKKMLILLSRQMKKLLLQYPKLKDQLSQTIREFLITQVFDEAIELAELQRIIEIVKYKPDILRVQNVYTYNQDKNLKQIFHLRILVKKLLEELSKIATKADIVLQIDEAVLTMINLEIKDLCDPDDVLRVFRTIPKIYQVQKIVQRNIGGYNTLTHGHPVYYPSNVQFVQKQIDRPVIIKEQVPVFTQKGIISKQVQQVPIYLTEQKPIFIPTVRQVPVQRIIQKNNIQTVDINQEVTIHETKVIQVQKTVFEERVVQVPKQITVQIPTENKSIQVKVVEIERFQQRLVPVIQQIQKIKQVKVNVPFRVEQIKYIQVQNLKNNFIIVPEPKEVLREVPCYIEHTVQKPVNVLETIEKVVVTNTYQEIIKQVSVEKQICIIQEKPVPYRQQVTHLVKGDKEQIIVQVEKIVQVPLIQQKLILRDVQIEKIVPFQHRVEVPVIVQLNLPYIQYQPEIITVEVQKIVPYRQSVPYQVIHEIPVPIIIEKESIKPIRCIVQKIIEKMVEVPRVVEIQKIVEKIVVVPRIVEHVITVPQIVQVPVERQIEILKIVQIVKQYPVYITKQVIKQVIKQVQIPIQNTVYQTIQVQKLVSLKQSIQIPKQVIVQKRIPFEVIHSNPVQIFIEKIVEKIIQINNIEIKDRQVSIPFKHEIPIEIIQQKAIPVKKIIENILQIPQIITKPHILYQTKTVPQIVQVIVQKLVDRIKQVVFTDIKHIIQPQTKQIEVPGKELIVEVVRVQKQLQPQPYIVQKIVYINNIQEQGVQIRCQKPVLMRNDVLIACQKPILHTEHRQVARNIIKNRIMQMHDTIQTIKTIQLQGQQKVVTTQVIKPEIVNLKQEIISYLTKEVEKIIQKQIILREQVVKHIEVPGPVEIIHETQTNNVPISTPLLLEKIVERIALLPQIVEVTKHIYEITQQKNLNLLIEGNGQQHKRTWLDLLQQLRRSLQNQLTNLRNSTQTKQVREQITLIQNLLGLIIELIKFPLIIQVPKQVQKIIQKQKLVTIGLDGESRQRQIAANMLIEKLIQQLKRIKRQYNVSINLDDNIKNIFFAELKTNEKLEDKLKLFTNTVKQKFQNIRGWSEQHSEMLHSFLEQRFLMSAILKQANQNILHLRQVNQKNQYNQQKLKQTITKLNIQNIGLKNNLYEISSGVQRILTDSTAQQRTLLQKKVRNVLQTSNLKNILEESRYSNTNNNSSEEVQKLRNIVNSLQSELQSYRGGQSNRNLTLLNDLKKSKKEYETITTQYNRLKLQIHTKTTDNRTQDSSKYTREIEQLNQKLSQQIQQYNRLKQSSNKLQTELQKQRTQGSKGLSLQDQQKYKKIIKDQQIMIRDLQKRIKELEALLNKRNLEIQLELKKKLESPVVSPKTSIGFSNNNLAGNIGGGVTSSVITGSPNTVTGSNLFGSGQFDIQGGRKGGDERFQSTQNKQIFDSRSPGNQSRYQQQSSESRFQSGTQSKQQGTDLRQQGGFQQGQQQTTETRFQQGTESRQLWGTQNRSQQGQQQTSQSRFQQGTEIRQQGSIQSRLQPSQQGTTQSRFQQGTEIRQQGLQPSQQQTTQSRFQQGTEIRQGSIQSRLQPSQQGTESRQLWGQSRPQQGTDLRQQGGYQQGQQLTTQTRFTENRQSWGTQNRSQQGTELRQQGQQQTTQTRFQQGTEIRQQIGTQSRLQQGQQQTTQTRQSIKYNSPSERFSSPQQPRQIEQVESSSSRISGLDSQGGSRQTIAKRNLTLRQLMNERSASQNLIAQIILKIIEKIQQDVLQRRHYLYSPDNIILQNYSPQVPDQLRIRLMEPIDRINESTRIYLSPQIIRGENPTQKSCVFNIGVIWDELLHGDTYFRSTAQIQSVSYEYKVRNNRLNPIFKNTLFQMLAKEHKRRLEINEIKRRLSLQKFISIEQSIIRTQYMPASRRTQIQQQQRRDN